MTKKREAAQKALAEAAPVTVLPDSEIRNFDMTAHGLFRLAFDQAGQPKGRIYVSSAFEVMAETRDNDSHGWGLLLRWQDRDRRQHQWICPRALLAGEGAEVRATMAARGVQLGTSQAARAALVEFLAMQRPAKRVRTAPRVGWHHGMDGATVFVLPDRTVGELPREAVMLDLNGAPAPTIYRSRGTLEGWRSGVAAFCPGNILLLFSVSCGFAGPLLGLLGEAGGGIHVYGQSRRGKSTALHAAASVWGAPRGHQAFARSWRATGNALEATAAEHSDVLLPLDEIGQLDPREAGEAAYMLANGVGKMRAGRDGRARPAPTWCVLVVSTGEKRLSDVMAEAGKRIEAGQAARLVDIGADAGAGMGLFQALHGSTTPAAFAERLDGAMREDHGVAGPAYLAWLVQQLGPASTLAHDLEYRVKDAVAAWLPPGSDGQVRTVARRCAIIGIGGELATTAGITGWAEGVALEAAGACFLGWLLARGGAGAAEDMQAVELLRAALLAHGQARFELWRDARYGEQATGDEPPAEGRVVMHRLGWRRWVPGKEPGTGSWRYYISAAGWREIMNGLDVGAAARAVSAAGFLALGPKGTTRTVKIPGYPQGVACFVVDGSILSGRTAQVPAADGNEQGEKAGRLAHQGENE